MLARIFYDGLKFSQRVLYCLLIAHKQDARNWPGFGWRWGGGGGGGGGGKEPDVKVGVGGGSDVIRILQIIPFGHISQAAWGGLL
jgi:hypothetical protein